MLSSWFALVGLTVGSLLPIANPFSTAPVFVALTRRMRREHRLNQAYKACFYMACVLLATLLVGALVLEFFGISLPALRIAGGLIIARLGFNMLTPGPADDELTAGEQQEAEDRRDIAFTPIAMPLLSGPGSIAVTISAATEVDNALEYVAVAVGIVLVAGVSWLVLRSATRVVGYLGVSGVTVLTRLMGLVLVGIGVQFVATGFVELITDPEIAGAIGNAYPEP
ncbi:MAG: MarC family NAAT transporter [Gammaproteobacteria bacterium]|jgi:multiple antibiotic resistance protein|nr:MarC family NAAT transporter [Gammaproteobacteria bacterium]